MKLLPAAKALAALLLLLPAQAAGRQDGDYIKWDNGIGHSSWDLALEKGEREKALRLWEAIGEDLKAERGGLAGTYLKGGYNAGYYFRWSAKTGYVLFPYFDQNLITDFGYGTVNYVDDSEVVFTPVRELKGGRGLGKTPRKWTALGRYFVPVEMLREFGQYMAGFGRYNEFNGQCCEFAPEFLVSRIDREGEKFDYPVPPKYARFIRRPIDAEVTHVGKKRRVRDWGYAGKLYSNWMERAVLIPVRISAGRTDGVKPNMLFRLVGEPDFYQYLQVTRVGRKTASGYVVRDVSSDWKETYRDHKTDQDSPLPPVRVGAKVTTGTALD